MTGDDGGGGMGLALMPQHQYERRKAFVAKFAREAFVREQQVIGKRGAFRKLDPALGARQRFGRRRRRGADQRRRRRRRTVGRN